MVDYATEHEADLVIFAGDAFKSQNPNPTFQREFAFAFRTWPGCARLYA